MADGWFIAEIIAATKALSKQRKPKRVRPHVGVSWNKNHMEDVKKNNPALMPSVAHAPSSHTSSACCDLQLLPYTKDAPPSVEAFVQKVNATVATPAGTWERYTPRVMRSSTLHLLVPTQEDQPVGYAALEGRYLSFFALLPGYRRRGLGGHVIESLLHKNGGMLSLHVRASNDAARRFYDNLAGPRVSVAVEEDGFYDDGGERLRYVLALRPSKQLS